MENIKLNILASYSAMGEIEVPAEIVDHIQDCWVKWDTLYIQLDREYDQRVMEFQVDLESSAKRPDSLRVETEEGETIEEW